MTPPSDLSVNHVRAHEVEVKLTCGEECQFGILKEADGYLKWGPVTTNNIAKFRGLESGTNYTVFARRRYQQREWFYAKFPFGALATLNVATCPENMEGYAEIRNATCFAMNGFYESTSGQAESCKILASKLPFGALDNACTESAFTVLNLSLSPGFWRASLSSTDILKCPQDRYCLGTSYEAEPNPSMYCSINHTGTYCSDCVEGFKLTIQGCIQCDKRSNGDARTGTWTVILLYIAAEIALCAYVIFTGSGWRMAFMRSAKEFAGNCCKRFCTKCCRKKQSGRQHNGRSRLTVCSTVVVALPRHVYWNTKARILLGYLQVLFSFQRTFRQKASVYKFGLMSLLDFVSIVSVFELLDNFNIRCLFDVDHYLELLVLTLAPIALLSVLVLVIGILSRTVWQRWSTFQQDNLIRSLATAVLFLLFLVYPSVSETIFATFWCENFDTDGSTMKSALIADYRLSCLVQDDPRRNTFIAYAALMVFVYPAGILLLYTVLLCHHHRAEPTTRNDRKDETKVAESSPPSDRMASNGNSNATSQQTITFLTRPYKAEFYWFEAYELLRKLCMTSLLSFLQTTPLARGTRRVALPLIALNVVVFFCLILTRLQPYERHADFLFAVASLCMLLPATQLTIFEPFGGGPLGEVGGAVLVYTEIGLFFTFIIIESIVSSCAASHVDPLGSSTRTQPATTSNHAQTGPPGEVARNTSIPKEEAEVPVQA